jgi:hypothetical protein
MVEERMIRIKFEPQNALLTLGLISYEDTEPVYPKDWFPACSIIDEFDKCLNSSSYRDLINCKNCPFKKGD